MTMCVFASVSVCMCVGVLRMDRESDIYIIVLLWKTINIKIPGLNLLYILPTTQQVRVSIVCLGGSIPVKLVVILSQILRTLLLLISFLIL